MKRILHHSQLFSVCVFMMLISVGLVQAQPSFTSTPVTSATVGSQYTYAIAATDPSNVALTFSAVTQPAWLTLNGNGQSSATQFGGNVSSQPSGVAGDPAGNIYVSGSGTTIHRIAPDGTTTAWFTREAGLAYALYTYNGYLYISYYTNNVRGISCITKVNLANPTAETLVYASAQNGNYLALTYHSGYLYIAAYGQAKIIRVNASTLAANDVVSISTPWGVSFNSAGILYIASISNGIYTYNLSTNTLTQVLSLPSSYDVIVDANDNIYVGTSQFVRKYTPNMSSYITVYTSISYVLGMTLTPTGALVFGDYGTNKIFKLQTGASLTGTPAAGDIGTHNVSLQVSNGTTTTNQNFTITVSGPPTISAMPNMVKTFGDAPVTLTNPSSNSAGSFSYSSNNNAVASVSGNTITIAGAGTATITATQAASGLYISGTKTFTVTVNKAVPVISPLAAQNKLLNTGSYSITAPVSSSNGAFTYTSSNTAVATVSGNTVNLVGTGISTITATQAATANYSGGSTSALLTVTAGVGPTGINNGILMWLDASDIDGDGNAGNDPSDNTSVAVWKDKSGLLHNATTFAGKNNLTYITNQINGKSVARFTRVNDALGTVLEATGVDIRAAANPAITMFTVYKQGTHANDGGQGQALWGNDDGNWDRFFYNSWSFSNDGIVSLGTVNPTNVAVTGAGNTGVTQLMTAVYNNGVANGSNIYFNGAVVNTFTDHTDPSAAKTNLRIGWDGDNGTFNGDIAEFIVYNRKLTNCEIQQVNQYLAAKYGVTFTSATITAGTATTFCEGGSVTLTASAGDSYQWYQGGVAIASATGSTYTATASGNYTVTITTSGCTATSLETVVTVSALPTVTIASAGGTTACPGSSVTLQATAAAGTGTIATYQWYKNGAIISGANADSYAATATGSYNVTVFNSTNCSASSNAVTITIQDILPPVFTSQPQIVTPVQSNGAVNATSAAGAIVAYTQATATDNCSAGNVTVVSVPASGSVFPIGTSTVTYTATDAAGLTVVGTFNVTVIGIAPEIVCPANIVATATTGQCGANVNFAATETTAIPASVITYTVNGNPVQPGSFFPVGTTTVVATAANAVGSATCSFTVTVTDQEVPVIVSAANLARNNDAGTCGAFINIISPVATDNCGIASVTGVRTDGLALNALFPVGQTSIAWTATDIHGLTAVYTQLVTVTDHTAPVAITQNIMVPLNASGQVTVMPSQVDNGSNDNCTPVTLAFATGTSTGVICATANEGGTLVLNAPAGAIITGINFASYGSPTGSCGNFSLGSCNAANSKAIVESLALGKNSVSISATNGLFGDPCYGTVKRLYVEATYTIAGNTSSTASSLNFDCSKVGANTVYLLVKDGNGNESVKQAIITVTDTTAATVVTKDITVTLAANGTASITASDVNDGSSDACGIQSMTVSTNNFSCANIGANNVTLTVTDVHGNVSTGIAIVTVRDQIVPTVITKNITVALDANGTASVTSSAINNGSYDNCSIASVSLDKTSFDCSNVGANTVTLTVTDVNGNVSTGTATVTVQDTTAATVVTKDITIMLAADGTAGITASDVNDGSSDACGIQSVTASINNFTCANIGANQVTLTVTDVHGNVSTGIAIVTVRDLIAPTVITRNVTVALDVNGAASVTASAIDNGSYDNCGITSVSLDKTSFDCSNVGANNVTLTVTDVNGNVSTGTAIVTVQDLIIPTVITKNVTVALDANGAVSVTASAINNGSYDNCGITSVILDKTSFDCSNVGDNTVTLTVTDVNGNVSSATAVVTVQDLIAPTVITKNISIQLDASGNASITAADVNNGSEDACGIQSITVSQTAFNCAHVGNNTVTLTVTDHNQNVATAAAIVTVTDVMAPVITAPPAQVFCANADGSNQYTIPAATATDNCSVATVAYAVTGATGRTGTGYDATGVFAIGTSTITWTVTDVNGNVAQNSITVTVNPLPVATYVSSNADAFCNQTTLTASSSIDPSLYSWSNSNAPAAFSSNPLLSLGLTNGDGNYYLYVRSVVTGCTSAAPAIYNFQKQTVTGSYTILAYKEVELGKYNKVLSGSVGLMSAKGEAEFKSYSSVSGAGSFVKAPKIEKDGSGIILNAQITGVAVVTLPTMQYNTANTHHLGNFTASQNNAVVTGNYKNLVVKKGISVTVSGTTFGYIRLEEGASIRFTSPVLNIENFTADRGAKNNDYSYIRFNGNTSIRVSNKVSLGSQVLVNPDNHKVTFYMADQRKDEEKFTVKGGDTRVIANILMPNGKLRVTATDADDDKHDNRHGDCDHRAHNSRDCRHRGHDHNDCDHRAHTSSNCRDDVYMTGLFIAEKVESKGNTVIWNSYDCNGSTVAVITHTPSVITQATTSSEKTGTVEATTEEELKVTVMPNPSTTYFTLKLESKYSTPVNMRVLDANGRVVDVRSKIGANSSFQIGHNYSSGTYYAELIQGTKRKVVQLIKARG